jgi:hypothetical protein
MTKKSKRERIVKMFEAKRPSAGQADDQQNGDDESSSSNFITMPTPDSIQDPTAEPWVKQFQPHKRSQLALLMRFATRETDKISAEAALRRFRSKVMQNRELRHVLDAMQADPEGALRYAQAIVAEERLPKEERWIRQRARSAPYRYSHMVTQPPTGSQIVYLRQLGYRGPKPGNRLAAKQLIGQLIQGGHEA